MEGERRNILSMPSAENKKFAKATRSGKMIYGLILLILFTLIGIGTSVYWMFLLIKSYAFIGWVLLSAFIFIVVFYLYKYNQIKSRKNH